MARIHHARPQQQQGISRAIAIEKTRAAVKKKKPYKIVLEAVTQEKKKLHSILTYASNAPQGFGFVPAGHPEITEWCKEQCRQRNLDVHIVSAKPKNKMHADPEKLSHHVHRVGHHFPLDIIKLACSKFGYEYDEDSGLRKTRTSDRENWMIQQVESYSTRQALHGRPTTEKGTKDHISGAVREMFPKIPEADLSSIVNHAFEEGTNRVGNAKELSLARRVQLAVVAHIRHTYTDYDKMLKTGSWMEARQKVEHVSLAKLKEWRDETGEQSNEIEDTFREVIVLDDDEDETSDGGDTPDEREQSMEIVSNRVTAHDIQLEHHPQYPSASDYERRRGHGRTIFVHPYPPPSSALGSQAPQYRAPMTRSVQTRQLAQPEPFYSAHSKPPIDSRHRPTVFQPEPRRAPNFMRDSDGRLYELQPIDEPRAPSRVEYDPPYRTAARYTQEDHVHSSPRVNAFDAQYSRLPLPPSRRASELETVLPSVEPATVDLVSPPRHFSDRNDVAREYDDHQSSKQKELPPVPYSRDVLHEHTVKRKRPSMHDQEVFPRPGPTQSAEHSHMRMHPSTEPRSRHRAHPSQEVVDLTSSPRPPPPGVAGGRYVNAQGRPTAGPSNRPYIPEVQRRCSPEVRNGYHDYPVGAQPYAYRPDSDRMYQRRPPPAHDYVSLRR
ncbi:uncharacterized protein EKO05_0009200 [Ascochyta rabiei]|uniref:uncharacterized protein n=1 Tax=Didymella rabiei TaxID=5454 RepID=UPI0021FBC878|nr:uncharacterized protein EKO05_0009200 [Ascochyta rabiei]UPX18917.1 hypothetical protein EKO05_0009200 [Ascochyta rabiei]